MNTSIDLWRTKYIAVTDRNACFRFKAGSVSQVVFLKKYDQCLTAGETLVLFVTFVGMNKYLSPI